MAYGNDLSPADIAACTGNCNNNSGGWGGAWGEWILVFLIFAVFGWNGFGGGFGGYGGGMAQQGYDTRADIQRGFDTQAVTNKLNGLENGLCDGFYAQNTNTLNGFAGVQNTLTQGFAGVNTALVQQGYETRLASQGLGSQLASCCCDIREGIQANTTQGVMNTNAIQQQISNCCCDLEKQNMQSRFDAQQYNCSTLQAIDRVGDRIIDYLAADKAQALRDENQALRLAASQQAQNNYLVNQLRPCPTPAYITCNPWAASYGIPTNSNYGCGGGCGCNCA